ncbi:MAG: HmuY family protein [Flavobacteriaceae bacterium]|nr:HmuY family protein [Flavobacteriaceae bacterium]
MKTIKLLVVAIAFIGFTSCDDDNDMQLVDTTSEKISNLHAPQQGGTDQMGNQSPISGDFSKFDFATGLTTTSATEWDIAFRGTTIIINGGISFGATDEPIRTGESAVYIASGTLASVTGVDVDLLIQDSITGYAILTGSNNGWYTYAGAPTHLIAPTPGKILVIKTRNGRYAKIEILSYYKNAPSNPDAFVDEDNYYTFNYVYQPNEGVTEF